MEGTLARNEHLEPDTRAFVIHINESTAGQFLLDPLADESASLNTFN